MFSGKLLKMRNTEYKHRVKEILSNSIDINSSHTSNIINSSIELNKNRIYTEVKQGWKLNNQKEYKREAYLYLKAIIENNVYYIDINKNITINKTIPKGIYKNKPSEKLISRKIKENCI